MLVEHVKRFAPNRRDARRSTGAREAKFAASARLNPCPDTNSTDHELLG
jgi:hypothetical protein